MVNGSPRFLCRNKHTLLKRWWDGDEMKKGLPYLLGFFRFILHASLHLTKVTSWEKPWESLTQNTILQERTRKRRSSSGFKNIYIFLLVCFTVLLSSFVFMFLSHLFILIIFNLLNIFAFLFHFFFYFFDKNHSKTPYRLIKLTIKMSWINRNKIELGFTFKLNNFHL